MKIKSTLITLIGFMSAFSSITFAEGIDPIPTRFEELPRSYGNGSKISLECGRAYMGVLEVSNFKNITIETKNVSASCPRAVITPARPVSNWKSYDGSGPLLPGAKNGNVFVADVPYPVTQVFVDGELTGIAHYPDSVAESGWLVHGGLNKIDPATGAVRNTKANGLPEDGTVMHYKVNVSGLPSNDIVGARAHYRGPHPWSIGTRLVTDYAGGIMTLPVNTDQDLRGSDAELDRFYLEGKPWMISTPGEWAWSNGKLYIMLPPGQTPVSRVLATPAVNAVINARGSDMLVIKNVRILGGRIGVDGGFSNQRNRGSTNLQIINTEIAYSNWVGFYASKAAGFSFDGSSIYGALSTGIYAREGVLDDQYETIAKQGIELQRIAVRNSLFKNVNTIGMHKGSDASIYINHGLKALVEGNTVLNSGKSGIYIGVSRYAYVKNNKIYGACRIHGDCGGIYLISGTKKTPLYTTVEGNTVTDVDGTPIRPGRTSPERYGIYLDDYTTQATIIANTLMNNDSGMQVHLGSANLIKSNLFVNNKQRQVLISDSGSEGGKDKGTMRSNIFVNNKFVGPSLVYFLAVGNPESAANLGVNNYNEVTAGVMVDPPNVCVTNCK